MAFTDFILSDKQTKNNLYDQTVYPLFPNLVFFKPKIIS